MNLFVANSPLEYGEIHTVEYACFPVKWGQYESFQAKITLGAEH